MYKITYIVREEYWLYISYISPVIMVTTFIPRCPHVGVKLF